MNSQVDLVIKIGGRGLIDAHALAGLARDLKTFLSTGQSVVVVHGGGPAINEELTRRGITWNFIDGQRVTTPEMMDVIEMVLCGDMNRKVVRALVAEGVDAVGFSGVDGQTLQCSQFSPDLDRVGRIDRVNTKWLVTMIRNGGVPVLAPIGGNAADDGDKTTCNSAYNINADWVAARVAVALQAKRLVFLTDQNGILDANGEVMATLGESELAHLVTGQVVTGGMLAKVQTIRYALANGVADVCVAHAAKGLLAGLQDSGTRCSLSGARESMEISSHLGRSSFGAIAEVQA